MGNYSKTVCWFLATFWSIVITIEMEIRGFRDDVLAAVIGGALVVVSIHLVINSIRSLVRLLREDQLWEEGWQQQTRRRSGF